MKIYDCFQFFDEEMLLDLRLNIMNKHVDKFVITEATYMHSGKPKKLIFDIDWQGAEQIKEKKLQYKLITFFILPPSKKVLFERLSNRDMKDKLIIEERMKQFSKDVLHWKNYDFVVINDNLEKCYNEVSNLINPKSTKLITLMMFN